MAEHGLQREASNLPLTTSHHVDPGMESGMGSGSIVVSPSFCCLRYRPRSRVGRSSCIFLCLQTFTTMGGPAQSGAPTL